MGFVQQTGLDSVKRPGRGRIPASGSIPFYKPHVGPL